MKEQEKKVTKAQVYCTDLFFIFPFGLITLFGIIAVFVVGLFMGVSGFVHLFKSFYFEGVTTIIGGLVFSIMVLACTVLLGWVEYLACTKSYKGLKKYLQERAVTLKDINGDK